MRLSELLQLPDFKNIPIAIIGHFRTDDGIYAILGRQGQKILSVQGNTHLVKVSENDPDPEVSKAEELSIRRRFHLPLPPLASSSSHKNE